MGMNFSEEDLRVVDVIQTILGPNFWDHGIFLFTHGDQYELRCQQEREAEQRNIAVLPFETYVKRHRLSRNRYALGPMAQRLNFTVVKFENGEEDLEKRRVMVNDLFAKIDVILQRNDNQLYNKSSLPLTPQLVLPRYHEIYKVLRNLRVHFRHLNKFLQDSTFIMSYHTACICGFAIFAAFLALLLWTK